MKFKRLILKLVKSAYLKAQNSCCNVFVDLLAFPNVHRALELDSGADNHIPGSQKPEAKEAGAARGVHYIDHFFQ